jgi:PPK2 family polyphosphate:nucleotide phosphotransferase
VDYSLRADGSRQFRLAEVDPAETSGLDERQAEERLAELTTTLRELQELLFSAERNGILVILQGMDAAGKDVTIGNVFAASDPASCRIAAFKQPTPDEEAHHFLWRFDCATPARGELVIFDRSYYEEVVRPQVHHELPDDAIAHRFEHINAFERLLGEEDLLVLKFFLHVSEPTQRRRLEDRQANPETAWKISASDWQERRHWDDYMTAYEATINASASPDAPWFVVPSDHQWFHNLAVAEALVSHLEPYRDAWIEARDERGAEQRAEAEAARQEAE